MNASSIKTHYDANPGEKNFVVLREWCDERCGHWAQADTLEEAIEKSKAPVFDELFGKSGVRVYKNEGNMVRLGRYQVNRYPMVLHYQED